MIYFLKILLFIKTDTSNTEPGEKNEENFKD